MKLILSLSFFLVLGQSTHAQSDSSFVQEVLAIVNKKLSGDPAVYLCANFIVDKNDTITSIVDLNHLQGAISMELRSWKMTDEEMTGEILRGYQGGFHFKKRLALRNVRMSKAYDTDELDSIRASQPFLDFVCAYLSDLEKAKEFERVRHNQEALRKYLTNHIDIVEVPHIEYSGDMNALINVLWSEEIFLYSYNGLQIYDYDRFEEVFGGSQNCD